MQHLDTIVNNIEIDYENIDKLLNSLVEEVQKKIVELTKKLAETLDFTSVEKEISKILNDFSALLLEI